MKKILLMLIFVMVFSSTAVKVPAYSSNDITTSHIKPVIIYSEVEKYLRNKWSAYAVPAVDTREVLEGGSYAVWFTPELGDAWFKNKNQQNLWTRRERWRAKNKLSEGLGGKLQFQFYLKANTQELRLNEEDLYDVKVFLGDDRGNVYEPVKLEKGPLDELVHNNFYHFIAYFSERDQETLEKIIDSETKFVKIALKLRGSKYFFKWDLK